LNSSASLVPAQASEQQVLAAFERALGSPRLSNSEYVQGWVRRVRCGGVAKDHRVQLAVQDKFYRDFIDEHFRGDIVSAMEAELGTPVEIEWVIDESMKALAPVAPPPPPPVVHAEKCRLDERYVFETFVSAPSNQLAYAGAQAVADNPGTAFNPLSSTAAPGWARPTCCTP